MDCEVLRYERMEEERLFNRLLKLRRARTRRKVRQKQKRLEAREQREAAENCILLERKQAKQLEMEKRMAWGARKLALSGVLTTDFDEWLFDSDRDLMSRAKVESVNSKYWSRLMLGVAFDIVPTSRQIGSRLQSWFGSNTNEKTA